MESALRHLSRNECVPAALLANEICRHYNIAQRLGVSHSITFCDIRR